MATFTIISEAQLNQAPDVIGDTTLNLNYGVTHTFTVAEFTTGTTSPYSDPEGDPASQVQINSAPSQGEIKFNGNPYILGTAIDVADITLGLLTYESDLIDTDGYVTTFVFKVADVGSGQFSLDSGNIVIISAAPAMFRMIPHNAGIGDTYELSIGFGPGTLNFDYGNGVIESVTRTSYSVSTHSYTYPSLPTGDIIISGDLNTIDILESLGSMETELSTTELAKCENIVQIEWGRGSSNGILSGDLSELTSLTSLTQFFVADSAIIGDIGDLPDSILAIDIQGNGLSTIIGTPNLHGNIAGLPTSLLSFDVGFGPANTISGDITNLPTLTKLFHIDGENTVTGNVNTFKPAMEDVKLEGLNTVYGLIEGTPGTVKKLHIDGNSTVSGDFNNLQSGIERLVLFSDLATSGGSISNLPPTLTFMELQGPLYTPTGNIDTLPSGMTYLKSTSPLGAIGGDIANLPTGIVLLVLDGNNTLTGLIENLPTTLTRIELEGLNTITGNPTNIHPAMGNCEIEQGPGGGFTSYSGVFTYDDSLQVKDKGTGTPGTGLSTSEVDQFIIDFDSVKTPAFGIVMDLTNDAHAPRSAVSDAAYTSLTVTKGYTILTN